MLPYPTPPEGGSKSCARCKEDKALTAYGRDKKRKDGLQVYCKACLKAYAVANKERISAHAKAYREANRDEVRERKRAYRQRPEVRDHHNAKNREWKRANAEKVRESGRRYAQANREKLNARARQRTHANPEAVRARARQWREVNTLKVKAYRKTNRHRDRAYYADHRDGIRVKREARCRWCVYQIDFVSGFFYVGSSNRPDLRFNAHKSRAQRGRNSALLNAQDWGTATWRVLVECETEAEALAAEYNTIEGCMTDPNCLNATTVESRASAYWVYVIQSEQPRMGKHGPLPGYHYVGMTTSPARRLREHNGLYANGEPGNPNGSKYTSQLRPWVARACYGPYPNRSEALKAEYALKRGKRGAARCKWTPEDSPYCRGEGVLHPWVADPTGWKPPKG
jgi:predicted GIY-YIG superfamily endonuclease